MDDAALVAVGEALRNLHGEGEGRLEAEPLLTLAPSSSISSAVPKDSGVMLLPAATLLVVTTAGLMDEAETIISPSAASAAASAAAAARCAASSARRAFSAEPGGVLPDFWRRSARRDTVASISSCWRCWCW